MQAQPNIIMLMTDQQRFDAMSCAGNARIRTPNLDALAERGVRFTSACCGTPVCVPSRMSIITGHRAARHRWVTNSTLLGQKPELPTLMTLLHRVGYHTHAVGKMHFRRRHYGLEVHERMEECLKERIADDYLMYLKEQGVRVRYPQGLRDLLYYQPQTSGIPVEHSQSDWVTKRSIECLREHVRYRNRPLFLWSSWTAPHPPFAPCEPYDSLYDPQDMDLPVYPERPLASLPSPTWSHRARLDGAHLDPDRIRRIRALYYGQISQVDQGIGQILDEVDRLGLRENTIVLFFSDHGDMLGDHGLSQKNVPYEASVRVPLIVSWPGRTEAGRISDDLAGLTDILPTFIDGLGLEYPEAVPSLLGTSLLSQDGGGLKVAREGYFIDYGNGRNRWVCLRTREYKYALWAAGGMEELYNMESDPHEMNNVLADEPEIGRDLRERVIRWEREHGLVESFDGEDFRAYPRTPVPDEDPRGVTVNEGRWPENLPEDEQDGVESHAEAFIRAIAKESSLSPEKLSLAEYKRKGGDPLIGTPWESEWRSA